MARHLQERCCATWPAAAFAVRLPEAESKPLAKSPPLTFVPHGNADGPLDMEESPLFRLTSDGALLDELLKTLR
jgi:hypothetical protein